MQRQLGWLGVWLILIAILVTPVIPVMGNNGWPAWERFKTALISDDGRVVDGDDERLITTSEGQSYALFFSLVANDRDSFALILDWTQNNLAQGDLGAVLPAWLWGHDVKNDRWDVLDANSAADADLWLAYTLLEAGRLWQRRDYQVLATRLAKRIAAEEVVDLPGFGPMVLPGNKGFTEDSLWRVNPSYLPPQLLTRLSELGPPWPAIAKRVPALLEGTAPLGLAPDWAAWHESNGWQADPVHGAEGDYDAIRVYLWLGMLAEEAPQREALIAHFTPMAALTARLEAPPEQIDAQDGKRRSIGNSGFSAALLPFLAAADFAIVDSTAADSSAVDTQRRRLADDPPAKDAYYAQSLTLFGNGWDRGRYRFAADGTLQPQWSSP